MYLQIQLRLSVLLLGLVLTASAVSAQTINGVVTDASTGEPLAGVNVTVGGTLLGTVTGVDGSYSLDVLGGESLVFSFIGFLSKEIAVSEGTTRIDVTLEEDVLGLEEIVVTGIGTSVKRTNLANSVGTISASELVPAPAQTLERALSGKVAGLSISQNTGAPGGGIHVNIRGTSTLIGSTQPLYVVDGVIVDNSSIQSGMDIVTAATGAGSPRPQGQPSSRVADLNPNDIETIEVLKGASAAAIYGSKASNGVVIITTKQGRPGSTRIDITQRVGFQSILKELGLREFTPETAEARQTGGAALLSQNGNIDYESLLYGRKGFLSETSFSASGGDRNTRYFVGGLVQTEDGIVENTGYDKYSGKVNVSQKLGTRLGLDVYTTFVRSSSDRSITGNENQGSTTLGFASVFTPRFVDIRQNPDGTFPDGPAGSNPLHTIQVLRNNEVTNRGLGSARLTLGVIRERNQTLDLIVQGGADVYSTQHRVVSPPELQFERAKDSAVRGISIAGETTSLQTSLNLNAVHRYSTGNGITFNTSGGYQYETRDWDNVLVLAQGLTVTQENVDQASSLTGLQTREIQRERGFFLQEEVEIQDQFYVTAGFRADASSLIGDTGKYYFYPKAAGSWRLSQSDFWSGLANSINEFKIRVAFGMTGNLPPPNAKFTSLQAENIEGLGGVLIPTEKGNPDIEPERTQEVEFGIDAAFANNRATLEATYYRQNISDLILLNQLPSSSGFTDQFINAGDMRTEGLEIAVGITPVRKEKVDWTSRFNFFTTKSEITDLVVDPFEIGGFALSLGQFKIAEGVSPNTIVGLNEDGEETVYGNEMPNFTLGWNNAIRLGNVDINFLWDWKQGGEVVDLGLFLSDLGGTSGDLDTEEGKERLSRTDTGRYVRDGTYLKLREAGVRYSVDRATVQRWFGNRVSSLSFGVSGRNLVMITDYSGYDPEVSQFGNLAVGRAIDVIPFPSARSFYFTVSVGLQ